MLVFIVWTSELPSMIKILTSYFRLMYSNTYLEILRFWKMFGLLLNMEDNSILQCHKSPDIGSFSLKDISITIFPGQRKSTLVSNTIWPPCQQFFAR